MPIPKLSTHGGIPVPEWNLSPDELQKARRALAQNVDLSRPVQRVHQVQRASINLSSAVVLPRIELRDILTRPIRLDELLEVTSGQRKNQKDLSPAEWSNFISAFQTLATPGAATPSYQDFVDVHVRAMNMDDPEGQSWGVHTMENSDGRNFLAWHREYLSTLETQLQLHNPLVTIPYWNWIEDRAIPPALSNPEDLAAWGVTRGPNFNPDDLPNMQDVQTVQNMSTFPAFQKTLERIHGWVHNAVGGTMATSASPADPLFWLHHAFIDKLWEDRKASGDPQLDPPNGTETLLPPPIFTDTVSQVLTTTFLQYRYV
ncbi:MAG TPA: tyrosinase family protein [Ktedonobacteraceae bacterium]|nr:tyrosinase family protein [Ktedonobacteraceae bacterium]